MRKPPVYTPPDDSKVPHVRSSPGWQVRNNGVEHLIAPDGTDYVKASSRERADLIVDFAETYLPAIRLRRFETSGARRKVRREQRQIKRGQR